MSAAPVTGSESSALRFARAALMQGHNIYRVFFYQAGVLCAEPGVECNGWAELKAEGVKDLCLCPASVKRYDVARKAVEASNSQEMPFSLGGIVQLADAQTVSDRLVSFH
ncbi:MAG: DsrE/DsrF/TusD sulfur relay family protein [Pseudomonadales bacterium]